MMDWDRLQTLSLEVKRFSAAVVSEESGVKQARVSRFIKDQKTVTMHELSLIQLAVDKLKENEK
jgi:hypothetical protein